MAPVSTPTAAPDELDAWRDRPALQQPDWPDPDAVDAVTAQIAKQPPLVFAGECDLLKARMAEVAAGEAFVLQGGDCAETFEGATPDAVRGKLETLLQMAVVLTYAGSVPVVKIGRVAGQFAKPRSSPTESHEGAELPSYRGDAVNAIEFTPEARNPDPARMLDAYHRSASTLNLCRAFTSGGYADLHQVHAWNRDFVAESPAGQRYDQIAGDIDRALSFMSACGIDPEELHGVEFYSSHEALLLEYERALTRIDSRREPRTTSRPTSPGSASAPGTPTARTSSSSARSATRSAVKLGPTATADDALALIDRLNPDHEPGRLSFITRMGADKVRDVLPSLVERVSQEAPPVAWICDPMHGNTFSAPSGHKTRRLDHVLDEVAGFFEVHRALGTHPGGIHVEFTGEDVTECIGGGHEVFEGDLHQRYETACDPRLNRGQALDLSFMVAELYGGDR